MKLFGNFRLRVKRANQISPNLPCDLNKNDSKDKAKENATATPTPSKFLKYMDLFKGKKKSKKSSSKNQNGELCNAQESKVLNGKKLRKTYDDIRVYLLRKLLGKCLSREQEEDAEEQVASNDVNNEMNESEVGFIVDDVTEECDIVLPNDDIEDNEHDDGESFTVREETTRPKSCCYNLNFNTGRDSRVSTTTTKTMVFKEKRKARDHLTSDMVKSKLVRAEEKRIQNLYEKTRPTAAHKAYRLNQVNLKKMEQIRLAEIKWRSEKAMNNKVNYLTARNRPISARRDRYEVNKEKLIVENKYMKRVEKFQEKMKKVEENKMKMKEKHKQVKFMNHEHREDVIINKLEGDYQQNKKNKKKNELKVEYENKVLDRKKLLDEEKLKKLKEQNEKVEVVKSNKKAKKKSMKFMRSHLPPLKHSDSGYSDRLMLRLVEEKIVQSRTEIKSRSGFRDDEDEPSYDDYENHGRRYLD